mgnify:CR=1 FL=1|tara:strand:- start:354 stop:992 length:639 start_codon:yes stop_codon:yes gene_type:complete
MFNYKKYSEIRDFLKKNTESCQIIAISKNHPLESVLEAVNFGVRVFGENRVMEAKNKFYNLKNQNHDIRLHLTGPLQSNKVKTALQLFDVFHTLDREKIANEFSKHSNQVKNKEIFIQVNTGEENSKSGIYPKQVAEFVNYCVKDISLNIIGLMCIPPIEDDPKIHFNFLKKLAVENNLKKLSIGMSSDYEQAIKFNPTYIRLGTILFGNRN